MDSFECCGSGNCCPGEPVTCSHKKIEGVCGKHHYYCYTFEGCGLECGCIEDNAEI